MSEETTTTATEETTMTDPRILAIRADSIVGRYTCSPIDECFSDEELLARLRAARIRSAKSAVAWARRIHERDAYFMG